MNSNHHFTTATKQVHSVVDSNIFLLKSKLKMFYCKSQLLQLVAQDSLLGMSIIPTCARNNLFTQFLCQLLVQCISVTQSIN